MNELLSGTMAAAAIVTGYHLAREVVRPVLVMLTFVVGWRDARAACRLPSGVTARNREELLSTLDNAANVTAALINR